MAINSTPDSSDNIMNPPLHSSDYSSTSQPELPVTIHLTLNNSGSKYKHESSAITTRTEHSHDASEKDLTRFAGKNGYSNQNSSPTAAPTVSLINNNNNNPQLKQSLSVKKMSYEDYLCELRAAWPDLPNLTIEYRDLSYVIPIPIKQKPPNLISAITSMAHKFRHTETVDFSALRAASGVVKPGEMTLILAPPGHGKSLLLKALTGRLAQDEKCRGEVRFNGLTYEEALNKSWHVHKMTAYVDQVDAHIAQLSVRQTFEFAVKNSVASVNKLTVDEATKQRLSAEKKVDLMIEMLGLKEAENTIIGNDLLRGVSGGQRKRVTIGEMLCSAARFLALDEITTGLDSAAAYDVTASIKQWVKLMNGSVVAALLQPAPALYELFDNLILLREGTVVYNGPRAEVTDWLSQQGILIPHDQDEADFLVEFLAFPDVVQKKNYKKQLRRAERSQTGYISRRTATPQQNQLLRQVTAESQLSVEELNRQVSEADQEKFVGQVVFHTEGVDDTVTIKVAVQNVLQSDAAVAAAPVTTTALERCYKASSYWALIQQQLKETEHLRGQAQGSFAVEDVVHSYTHAQYRRPYIHSIAYHTSLNLLRQGQLLLKNSSFWGPRIFQSIFMGLVLGSLFWNLSAGDFYNRMGLIIFAPIFLAFSSMSEVPLSSEAKLVVYRQVDTDFYPVTSYILSVILIYLPLQIIETILFGTIIYFMANFVVAAGEFFFFLLCLFMLNLAWAQFFRLLAYALPNADVAQQLASPLTALNLMFAGFLITEGKIPDWLIWGYWMTPFSWLVRSLAQNEFLSSRYSGNQGVIYLNAFEMRTDEAYKWSGIGYMAGVFLLLTVSCIVSLSSQRFAASTGTRRNAVKEVEQLNEEQVQQQQHKTQQTPEVAIEIGQAVETVASDATVATTDGQQLPTVQMKRQESTSYRLKDGTAASALPFQSKDLSFKELCYSVTLPDGSEKQLLRNVSGYAKAGQCTALMGASGAGKSTLMDVIAGRKTAGRMTGSILLDGHVKENATFNRLCGYVEQNDIHLTQTTVKEALLFSAKLRLPTSVTPQQREAFVEELLHLLELKDIESRLITADADGLSPGQMKRVTIGVEMASNPVILFLDEPTSGLDSRAALLVMKVIKRIAQAGRTVLCTIHQPSSELFMQFDRLLLLASGGRTVYFGDIGEDADELIEYFQTRPVQDNQKVPLGEKDNPATWMLEFIGAGTAAKRDDAPDYAQLYLESENYKVNTKQVEDISQPKPGSHPTSFDSVYARDYWTQFVTVLERFNIAYFRDVTYNLTRFGILFFQGVLFGLLFLQIDSSDQPGLQSKRAAIFMAVGTAGVINCSAALPVLYRNRAVFYRERASYLYNSFAYSTAIAIIELPYILVGMCCFTIPFYFLLGLKYEAGAFFLFLLIQFLNGICFNYYGQLLVSLLPNILIIQIIVGLSFTFIFLFGGVFILPSVIPAGWKWMYYINWMPKAFLAASSHEFACTSIPCPTIELQGLNQRLSVEQYIGDSLNVSFDTAEYWKWFGWIMLTIVILRILVAASVHKISHLKR